ncbi:MAG: M23 family metallopeptidase [Firmicutes bacterium]|nr:M23 family metallopeptidase [Bacillota bacterium]MDH7494983.1 M23 family metallopeptidase [Bacillota bacterium]
MRTKLARDAAISFLVFGFVLAVSRSNLPVGRGVRSCVQALLTEDTSLLELTGKIRDATRSLLGWNPWTKEAADRENSEASAGGGGARSDRLPGGGPGDASTAPDTSEVVARSLARLTEVGATLDAAAVSSESASPDQPQLAMSRGPSGGRALPASVTRLVPEAGAVGESAGDDRVDGVPKEGAAIEATGKQESHTTVRSAPSSSPTPPTSANDLRKLSAPVSGRVTYGFGYRIHPIYRRRLFHEGIDVAAPAGATVRAAASGRVIRAGPCGTYGNIVELDHGGRLTTLYAHCSRILVRPGDKVRTGQKIAEVGSTGLSTGPHLHFEVSLNGKATDPFAYLEGGRRDRL